MIWISMYPATEHTSKWKRMTYAMIALIIFFINSFGFLANCAYIYKNWLTDIEGSLLAIMISSILGGLAYSYAVAVNNRYKMRAMYDKLISIHDAGKCFIYCPYSIINK